MATGAGWDFPTRFPPNSSRVATSEEFRGRERENRFLAPSLVFARVNARWIGCGRGWCVSSRVLFVVPSVCFVCSQPTTTRMTTRMRTTCRVPPTSTQKRISAWRLRRPLLCAKTSKKLMKRASQAAFLRWSHSSSPGTRCPISFYNIERAHTHHPLCIKRLCEKCMEKLWSLFASASHHTLRADYLFPSFLPSLVDPGFRAIPGVPTPWRAGERMLDNFPDTGWDFAISFHLNFPPRTLCECVCLPPPFFLWPLPAALRFVRETERILHTQTEYKVHGCSSSHGDDGDSPTWTMMMVSRPKWISLAAM